MTRTELADVLCDVYLAERNSHSWLQFPKLPFWVFERQAHAIHDRLNPVSVIGARDVDANGSPV